MEITLAQVPNGTKFTFGGVQFIKQNEVLIDGDIGFTCRIYGENSYVNILSHAMVDVYKPEAPGLYSLVNYSFVVRNVNEDESLRIIAEAGAIIVKHKRIESKNYNSTEFEIKARIDQAAYIAKEISIIEEKANKEGFDF